MVYYNISENSANIAVVFVEKLRKGGTVFVLNIVHLKYAVEVDKTKSISKAAENLYMGQPNLSRAIKELEDSLGITIFERSSKGMVTTMEGEVFLQRARKILEQINELEAIFKDKQDQKIPLSIGAPRSPYICSAFEQFAAQNNLDGIELCDEETSAMHVIHMVQNGKYNLGIIRYPTAYRKQFMDFLSEKGLVSELITEFYPSVLVSSEHLLAGAEKITLEELKDFTEIVYPDAFIPYVPASQVIKEECTDNVTNRIFTYNRAPAYDLLSSRSDTFMLSEPMPQNIQKRYQLSCINLSPQKKSYQDSLVFRRDYHLSALERQFVNCVLESRSHILG